ncbi:MAG: hypothetical protein AAF985_27300, partial [Bacteroidota bacterium]
MINFYYFGQQMSQPQEIADKYFEKFTQLSSITTKIIVITLVVIVSNWVFIVEANFKDYFSNKTYFQKNQTSIENELRTINNKIKYVNSNSLADDQDTSDDLKSLISKREDLVDDLNQLNVLKKSFIKQMEEEADKIEDIPSLIKFVIKFIFSLSGDLKSGALILNGLLLFVLSPTFHRRRKCILF